VTSPIFDVELPVLAHPAAEVEKGAGIAMCCTFGDTTDIDWWRDLQLPLRAILRKDGRIETETPEWITSEAGREVGRQDLDARSQAVSGDDEECWAGVPATPSGAGDDAACEPRCHLVVTGVGDEEMREQVRCAFSRILLRPEEMPQALAWIGADDGLGGWRGPGRPEGKRTGRGRPPPGGCGHGASTRSTWRWRRGGGWV